MDSPLKALRKQRELTLKEVADAIGTDTGNLSRIEAGLQQSPALAEKLVKFFGEGSISEIQILYPVRFVDLAGDEVPEAKAA